jgi:hypothetical protein
MSRHSIHREPYGDADTRPPERGGYGSSALTGSGWGGRGGCGGAGGTLTGDIAAVWWSTMAARQWQTCEGLALL